jgi:multidrug efflux system membrane fusion protein
MGKGSGGIMGRIMRSVSVLIGLAAVLGAILTVAFLKLRPPYEPPPEVIRPVKVIEVADPAEPTGRMYPGQTRAVREANIAFDVPGMVIERLVNRGDLVRQGDIIARLDPRDYQNSLNAALARQYQAQVHLDRVYDAERINAATPQEVTNAEAALEVAQAEVAIAQKAVEDTEIFAQFDGIIADVFVEQYENVVAKQAIVSLQDLTEILIDAHVPESRISEVRPEVARPNFTAIFEYLPGREFEVEFQEFAAQPDPSTQTFPITFRMTAPADITVWTGMTATLIEYGTPGGGPVEYAVPAQAVVGEGDEMFVWKAIPAGGEFYTVSRVPVEVARLVGDDALIVSGVSPGDQIVVAGTRFLSEGQTVRLWDPKRGAQTE